MTNEIRVGRMRSFTSGWDILGDRTIYVPIPRLASSLLFKHQHNLAAHRFDSASILDDAGWMRRLAAF